MQIKKILKSNLMKYFLILFIGLIITLPAIIPSYNLDGYCNFASGYLLTAGNFLKSARLFTALMFYLLSFTKIPYSFFSILSLIFSNVFNSLAVYKLGSYINNKNINKNKLAKLITFICSFLIFYNPMVLELFLFEESVIMFLGVYLTLLSAIKLCETNKRNVAFSLVYLILGTCCYQGVICYYLPILLLLLVVNKFDFKTIIQKIVIGGIIYGLCLIISYVLVKFINSYIIIDVNSRLGRLDIIENIQFIIQTLKIIVLELFDYINIYWFYIVNIILIILFLYLFCKNKEKNKLILLYLFVNISLCILMPFVPNLGMNSDANYTAARMCLSIGSTVGILGIYCLLQVDNKFSLYSLITIIGVYTIYIFTIYFHTTYIQYDTYKKDMNYLNTLFEKIDNYEKDNNVKVTKIYYAHDSKVDSHYSKKTMNSTNYRVMAIDWAMDCAVSIRENHRYLYTKMTDEEKLKYFANMEYDSINDKQFVFVDDALYLLIF